jgi:hypothetical protein
MQGGSRLMLAGVECPYLHGTVLWTRFGEHTAVTKSEEEFELDEFELEEAFEKIRNKVEASG